MNSHRRRGSVEHVQGGPRQPTGGVDQSRANALAAAEHCVAHGIGKGLDGGVLRQQAIDDRVDSFGIVHGRTSCSKLLRMDTENGGLTPLARAEALSSKIAAAAEEIDANRALPTPLADEMKRNGLFRLLVPRSVGGEEMDWLDYLDVVRTVAYADGSTGWCFNQGTVFATTSCRAPLELAAEVWGDPQTVVANGPPQGSHRGQRGRWRLPLDGPLDVLERLPARQLASRRVRWSRPPTPVAPAAPGRCRIPGCVAGQRLARPPVASASGSRTCSSLPVTPWRLNVPAREPGPIYVIPQTLLFACGFGCVALGVSRAGLDSTVELCSDKRPRFGSRPLCEDPVIQRQVGLAEAKWRAAKALLYDSVGGCLAGCKSDRRDHHGTTHRLAYGRYTRHSPVGGSGRHRLQPKRLDVHLCRSGRSSAVSRTSTSSRSRSKAGTRTTRRPASSSWVSNPTA